MRNTD